LHKIDNSGGRPFTKEKATLKKIYHKNTNMITISAMVFLMLLPLSSSVSTAGEALNQKLDYSLSPTNKARHGRNPTLMSSSDTMDSKEEDYLINLTRKHVNNFYYR